ncbi:selenide, water dikinase SelD [Dissulfurirhabdus thermomarina]|uniref:Selenide, water dikinase n=1 Tax=Dissulfurirhabdus thermomarina TaxID=1765737 RepID=A0A6N9TVA1_DISTH|nr:selenide, water dikinase SelD [Dissulfurirhabdus thermomarina]NDY42426.1 selenide, water dikinase SelD [Dissulfurirhabdus thermomarina]NMX23552.1 selenide, water dikinase SelD [Dissulfurirhabdus thermomarina]
MTDDGTIRLTQTVKAAGCAAKLPPGDLDRALCGLDLPVDDNLIVGLERADDAGVYRISDDLALVQTLDFFPPMVDDPYTFGRIAAANALSDIYAMGGTPRTAMNIVAFPARRLDLSILRRVIEGGLHTLRQAGVVLVGGHSVDDPELKYGLAVTGFIHPGRVLTKRRLRAGDRLILTKPLGTGIVCTALKAGLADEATAERVIASMSALNRTAADLLRDFPVSACTDVTGFGFLGHLAEMVVDSGTGVQVRWAAVPVFPEALEWADMGLLPAGTYHNREFRGPFVTFAPDVPRNRRDVLFDPQTSGGLLVAVPAAEAEALQAALVARGVTEAAIVGEVIAEPRDRILVG